MTEDNELLEGFLKNLENHQYPFVLIKLKKIFRKLDEFNEPTKEMADFLEKIEENFDLLVEPERKKKAQMQGVLRQYLENTFVQISPDDLLFESDSDPKNDFKLDNFEGLEKPGKNIAKERIAILIQENISLFLNLFNDGQVGLREILKKILIKILSRFPDESIWIFESLFKSYISSEDIEIFIPIFDKAIDSFPKPTLGIIFAWINSLEDTSKTFNKSNMNKISALFDLFKVYAEIYPDYFSNHLDSILTIILHHQKKIGKKSEILTNFTSIIHYFAKNGEIIIANYSIELFQMALGMKHNKNEQRTILLTIKELFENYPDEIAGLFIDSGKNEYIQSELLKLIAVNEEEIIIDLITDLYLLIRISVSEQNYTRSASPIEGDDEEIVEIPIFIIILEYTQALRDLSSHLQRFVYILFKAVDEISRYVKKYEKKEEISAFIAKISIFLTKDDSDKEMKSKFIQLVDLLEMANKKQLFEII